jgi:hypothetical protein
MSVTVLLPFPEVEVFVFVPPVNAQLGDVLFTVMVTALAVPVAKASESIAAAPARLARKVLVISSSMIVK